MNIFAINSNAREPSHDFRSFVTDIEQAYQILGHQRGWRFLCVSRAALDAPVDIAFITLNPTCNSIPDHPTESCENGIAHRAEQWGTAPRGQHKLQIQVQKLFEQLHHRLRLTADGDSLMQRSLIGYFVPFRSPRFSELPMPDESLAFGRDLWQKIIAHAKPRLIVCIDKETHEELQSIIPAATGMSRSSSRSFPTGWGKCTADLSTFGNERSVRLLRLPHLATFQLFSRESCVERIKRIIDEFCTGLPRPLLTRP